MFGGWGFNCRALRAWAMFNARAMWLDARRAGSFPGFRAACGKWRLSTEQGNCKSPRRQMSETSEAMLNRIVRIRGRSRHDEVDVAEAMWPH